MAVTVITLKNAVDRFIPQGSKDRFKADLILKQLDSGYIVLDTALKQTCAIHQNICQEADKSTTTGGGTLVNTGVFCKCTADFTDGGTVVTTPVAGGNNVIHYDEFFNCINARNPHGENYFYTPDGT